MSKKIGFILALLSSTLTSTVYNAAFAGVSAKTLTALTSSISLNNQIIEKNNDQQSKTRASNVYGKLPLSFIQNDGQLDKKVEYYEKGNGHSTYFTKEGVYLSLTSAIEESTPPHQEKSENLKYKNKQSRSKLTNITTETVRLFHINANKNPAIIPTDKQTGQVNFFIGKKENWKTNIPTYGGVIYKEVYPGIDIKYYGNNQQMEYDIVVKPGSNPLAVQLGYEGVKSLTVNDIGTLEIKLEQGVLVQNKPYIYQDINGKRTEINGNFIILPQSEQSDRSFSYSFNIAEYNHSYPLIIDPVMISYSTFLGGTNDDFGYHIAVDDNQYAYVTGNTFSSDFQTQSSIDTHQGSTDVFVTKFNATGTSLIYSTFIGGELDDYGYGIAVDSTYNVYITGDTNSTLFPVVVTPIQGDQTGLDAFVTKINPTGSALAYSTYLGGDGTDSGRAIAVDASGNAFVTGHTDDATNFPTAGTPAQPGKAALTDAFIAEIDSTGSTINYITYLGGSGDDIAVDIALDSSANAYVTGYTDSSDFPTAGTPYQGSQNLLQEVFVTKLDSTGSSFTYSTYIGGSGNDYANGITVDNSGFAYITGKTESTDYPTQPLATPTPLKGPTDAFVTKLGTAGSTLIYSRYLGGSNDDSGHDIAVDSAQDAYVIGYTNSSDFPKQGHIQNYDSGFDIFVTKINIGGDNPLYSILLGGAGTDKGYGIAVDANSNAYITGETNSIKISPETPTTSKSSNIDAFVAKLETFIPQDFPQLIINNAQELNTTEDGGQATLTIKLSKGPDGDVVLDISSSDTAEGTVSPASISFTTANWDTFQTVTITGVDDNTPDGNQQYAVNINIDTGKTTDTTGFANFQTIHIFVINQENAVNSPPTIPFLFYPINGQIELDTAFNFKWDKSLDMEGDLITYNLFYCTNSNFDGCLSTPIALYKSPPNSPLPPFQNMGNGKMLLAFLAAGAILMFICSFEGRIRKTAFIKTGLIATITLSLLYSCAEFTQDAPSSSGASSILVNISLPDNVSHKTNYQGPFAGEPIPSTIKSIICTITAPDLATPQTVIIPKNTLRQSFDVPSGPARLFTVTVTMDDGDTFSGSSKVDLIAGADVDLVINVSPPADVELINYPVSGLASATTYYWKVAADDGNGGIEESDVWSFTTK